MSYQLVCVCVCVRDRERMRQRIGLFDWCGIVLVQLACIIQNLVYNKITVK